MTTERRGMPFGGHHCYPQVFPIHKGDAAYPHIRQLMRIQLAVSTSGILAAPSRVAAEHVGDVLKVIRCLDLHSVMDERPELVATGTPALSLIDRTALFYFGKNIESLCAGAESKISLEFQKVTERRFRTSRAPMRA